jgi:HD domain
MRTPASLPGFVAALPLTRDALSYAVEVQPGAGEEREPAAIEHSLEVAELLHEVGCPDTVVAAGVLHDMLEDTDASPGDLQARFGPQVAELVAAMTEDPAIEPYEQRKAALRRQVAGAGPATAAVYAADKGSKVREYRSEPLPAPGSAEAAQRRRRLDHYEKSLTMLEGVIADHPLVVRLRHELDPLLAPAP